MSESEAGATRIAVVTGAGSGIGRHAALALADRAIDVVLAGRRQDALEETASLASKSLGQFLIVPTDVTSEPSVVSLI